MQKNNDVGLTDGSTFSYLFSSLDASAGADDDLVLLLHSHHLRDAVGRTRVVDVPVNQKTTFGGSDIDTDTDKHDQRGRRCFRATDLAGPPVMVASIT